MAAGGEGKETSVEWGAYGCALLAVAFAGSVYLAFRRPAIGIPLAILVLLLAWHLGRKADAAGVAAEARRRELGPAVGDVWRRLLEQEGLGDVVEDVAPHVRGAVRVSTRAVESLETGRSRVGGTPDLPRGLSWPRRDGVPMAFLAQFDLREVAQVMPEGPLPRKGHLWFFFDMKGWPSGSDPSDAGGAVVLFDAAEASLEATVPPPGLAVKAFPACAVSLERYDAIPDLENEPWLEERLGDEARVEAYIDTGGYLESGWSADPHTLLGFARSIQGVMELECQLVSNGIPFERREKDAARVKELEPGARGWRLLLQVASDRNAGMMWGDAGCLYFWIREEDLLAARFDRTWTVFQCH
jgi:uncharacterized protein YwqG